MDDDSGAVASDWLIGTILLTLIALSGLAIIRDGARNISENLLVSISESGAAAAANDRHANPDRPVPNWKTVDTQCVPTENGSGPAMGIPGFAPIVTAALRPD